MSRSFKKNVGGSVACIKIGTRRKYKRYFNKSYRKYLKYHPEEEPKHTKFNDRRDMDDGSTLYFSSEKQAVGCDMLEDYLKEKRK